MKKEKVRVHTLHVDEDSLHHCSSCSCWDNKMECLSGNVSNLKVLSQLDFVNYLLASFKLASWEKLEWE